ncbi:MAG: hypothetical protein AAF694_30700 [Bacteroidota bacterium]
MIFAIMAMVALAGCYYDLGEELRTSNECPPDSISFTAQVLPILDVQCNSCHSAQAAFGGVVLDAYDSVLVYVNDGSLLGSIKHEGGFSPMPPDQSKIPECEIQQLTIWVNEGSINN